MAIEKKEGIYVEDGNTYGSITYATYIGLESETSKPFIMIAELIDNSISSFENELSNQWTSDDKLIIDIVFNFKYNELKICKSDNKNRYLDGSFISVSDNGFGFKKVDSPQTNIKDALGELIIYGQKNQGSSNKNKWGKGLKNCVYYFGQDLEIITSNGRETAKLERNFTDPNIILDTRYPYDAIEHEKISRGTTIKISNIYEGKSFSKSTFETIHDSLSRRYINYFKKDLMEVNLTLINQKHSSFKKLELLIEPKRNIYDQVARKSSQTVIELLQNEKNFEEFKNKNDKEYKKRLIKYSRLKKDDEGYVNNEIFRQVYSNMRNLIDEYVMRKEKNAFIEGKINFSLEDMITHENVDVPFNYWILPLATKEKFSGIRFYEGERAIRHVCGNDKDIRPWKNYLIVADDANRTAKKFAGSIDFQIISLETVKDKSNFKLPEKLENILITNIWSVFKAMEIFIINIASTDEHIEIKSEEFKITKEIVNDSMKILNQSSKGQVSHFKEESDSKKFVIEREMNNENWKLSFVLDDKTQTKKKFFIDVITNNEIKIVIYTKNFIWLTIRKNFKDQKSFLIDMLSERLQTLLKHAIVITNMFIIDKEKVTSTVVKILNELGDDYIEQNISFRKK